MLAPINIGEFQLWVTASVGVSPVSNPCSKITDLIKRADGDMYRVKRLRKATAAPIAVEANTHKVVCISVVDGAPKGLVFQWCAKR